MRRALHADRRAAAAVHHRRRHGHRRFPDERNLRPRPESWAGCRRSGAAVRTDRHTRNPWRAVAGTALRARAGVPAPYRHVQSGRRRLLSSLRGGRAAQLDRHDLPEPAR